MMKYLSETVAYIAGHPLDVCACGDYRRDHEGGRNLCRVCRSVNHSFLPKCKRFRLELPATREDVERFKKMGIDL